MSAKTKLNAIHLTGAVFIGALFGALTGSWLAFWVTAGLIIAIGVHETSIRP